MSGERDAVGTNQDGYGVRRSFGYIYDVSGNPIGLAGANPPAIPKRSNVLHSLQLSLNNAAASTNVSWRDIRTAPGPYYQVRAYLFNMDTANTSIGHKVAFSPSESLANLSRPTISGSIDDSRWVTATWSGAGSVTLPVASAANSPSVSVSDWMTVPYVARTDILGAYPLVYTTWYNPATAAANLGYVDLLRTGTYFQDVFNAISGNPHLVYWYGSNAGDCVATPANFTNTTKSGAAVFGAIEFRCQQPAWSLLAIGDSITQGAQASGSVGYVSIALATMASAGYPFSVYNFGISGTVTSTFATRLTSITAQTTPNLILYCPWSPNDTGTYAGPLSNVLSRLQSAIAVAESVNAYLFVLTPTPYIASGGSALSGAEVTAYTTLYNYIKGCASARVRVLDLTALHDSTKPGVWSSTYGFDAFHPNTAGHAYIANLLTTALQNAISK